jgi:hypothetical protein
VSGGVASLILTLFSSRRKVVSFRSKPPYYRKNLRYYFIQSSFGLRYFAGYGEKTLKGTGI